MCDVYNLQRDIGTVERVTLTRLDIISFVLLCNFAWNSGLVINWKIKCENCNSHCVMLKDSQHILLSLWVNPCTKDVLFQ